MRNTLKKWLGFESLNEFTQEFFYRRNMRGSVSMSAIAIGLEIWMCLSLLKYMIDHGKTDTSYYFSHGYPYFLLLASALVMFGYCIHFARLKDKAHRSPVGETVTGIFYLTCLWFGTYYGLKSYAKGDQCFAFSTMVLFIFCLPVWRPYIGGVLSAVCCFYFYYVCASVPGIKMSYSFQVNFFTLWIVMFMFIMSNYRLTIAQAQKEENLIRQAGEDSLTGLLNQNGFDETAKEALQSGMFGEMDRILIINIENFKAYNEKYGLQEGDVCLIRLAEKIKEIWGQVPIARLHGDRFAVMTKADGLEEKAGELALYVREISRAKKVHLEIKIGACAPDESMQITLDNARFACASLHHKAGACLQVYDQSFHERVEMRQFVIGNIASAIEAGNIHAYYQPVIDAATGEIVSLEALARWKDPERGMVMPGAFIGTLEEFQLISMLDQEIVRQAVKLLHDKITAGAPIVPVSVNFSQVDFDLFDICDFLKNTVDQYHVPHELIEVEMTESALSNKPEVKKQLLSKLRRERFSVWLDDFGSGYSSLNILKEFRFDVLKIDMLFMREFGQYEKTREIMRAIIDLAEKLGARTLTEGVETPEQAEFLKEAGCDMMQGYLYAKPMDIREIEELVHEGKLSWGRSFAD